MINWDKPQKVRHKMSGTIINTTGEHYNILFQGTVAEHEVKTLIGKMKIDFIKDQYELLSPPTKVSVNKYYGEIFLSLDRKSVKISKYQRKKVIDWGLEFYKKDMAVEKAVINIQTLLI